MPNLAHNSITLNQAWRFIATIFGFAVFGLGTLALSLVLSLLLLITPVSSALKQCFTRRVIHKTARFYVWMLSFLGLVHLDLPDLRRLLPRGGLVVANHPMLLDAVFIMAVFPRAVFVVKSALVRNPFTALLVRHAAYLPNHIDGNQLVDMAAERIRAGDVLVIFPEGTRTGLDDQIRFRRGAANIALRAQCDIAPLAITCQPKLLRKFDPWYRVPSQVPIYRIELLPVLKAESIHMGQDTPGKQVRQLNRVLQARICSSLQSGAGFPVAACAPSQTEK